MEIIYLLISVSLLVALVFLGAFIWSAKSGQFDDSYGNSVRLLHDDDEDDHKPQS
ncbi:MAG: cbb3-type cytochrome oxidase assembly protein CcoS [Flavobacteriia bacterium]|nr:cbb3-type cytochrome oxidase assembly protein CcoS [Flavobacteriia bacterium]